MLTYGQRLKLNPIYGCILQSSVPHSFGYITRLYNLPTLTLGISLKYPWRVETVIMVCL